MKIGQYLAKIWTARYGQEYSVRFFWPTLYTTTILVWRLSFHDNLGKPAPEKQNDSGKTNLDLLEQETVSGSGISWAIRKSASHPRQITMPASNHSVFYRPDALPAAQPTASKHWRSSTEGV